MISAWLFILTVVVMAVIISAIVSESIGISILFCVLVLVAGIVLDIMANIKFLHKIGLGGWEWLIPYFCQYRVCEVIYGEDEGWKGLLQLIPVVGLIMRIKYILRISEVFNRSLMFGILMLLFPMPFFYCLAFSNNIMFNYDAIEVETTDEQDILF